MVTPNRINAEMLLQGTSSQFLAANSTPSPGWVSPAVQADQEAGSNTTKPITAGVQQYHQSSAKCWGFTTGNSTPVLNTVSYNMTSITDTGVGILTVTIGNSFSSNAYVTVTSLIENQSTWTDFSITRGRQTGSFIIESITSSTDALNDPGNGFSWFCTGDLP